MSNKPDESNEKISNFFKANLFVFLFYAIIGSFLTGSVEVISVLLPFHLVILVITGFFSLVLGKSPGQTLGYVILFLLLLAVIGFSICVGSINIH